MLGSIVQSTGLVLDIIGAFILVHSIIKLNFHINEEGNLKMERPDFPSKKEYVGLSFLIVGFIIQIVGVWL